jgi:hypothetical protein
MPSSPSYRLRERWLIRLTGSLNDSACGFTFPPYDWSVGRCHGWTVEIGEGHRIQTGSPVQSSKSAGETGRDSELDTCSARVRREQKAASVALSPFRVIRLSLQSLMEGGDHRNNGIGHSWSSFQRTLKLSVVVTTPYGILLDILANPLVTHHSQNVYGI